MTDPAEALRQLLNTMPVDHPDRPGIRRAIDVLRHAAGDSALDDDVLVLNRPPGVSDEEWRDLIGFARVTVTLKAREAAEQR